MHLRGNNWTLIHFGGGASLLAQLVKNPPAIQETWVQSLGWEDPLEESMATHSRILAWRIPMDKGDWQATVHGVPKSHTQLSACTHTHTHTLAMLHFHLEKQSQGGLI